MKYVKVTIKTPELRPLRNQSIDLQTKSICQLLIGRLALIRLIIAFIGNLEHIFIPIEGSI